MGIKLFLTSLKVIGILIASISGVLGIIWDNEKVAKTKAAREKKWLLRLIIFGTFMAILL